MLTLLRSTSSCHLFFEADHLESGAKIDLRKVVGNICALVG